MWVLEFSAHSIGQAGDIIRQHLEPGDIGPTVQQAGRCGYEVRSTDLPWLISVRDHVADEGGTTILEKG